MIVADYRCVIGACVASWKRLRRLCTDADADAEQDGGGAGGQHPGAAGDVLNTTTSEDGQSLLVAVA